MWYATVWGHGAAPIPTLMTSSGLASALYSPAQSLPRAVQCRQQVLRKSSDQERWLRQV